MRTPLHMAKMGARAAAELHAQCNSRIHRLLDELATAEPERVDEIQRLIDQTLKISERVNEQFVRALSDVAHLSAANAA